MLTDSEWAAVDEWYRLVEAQAAALADAVTRLGSACGHAAMQRTEAHAREARRYAAAVQLILDDIRTVPASPI